MRTTKKSDFVAVIPVSGLKTDASYPYTVLVDGKVISMSTDARITPAPSPNKAAKIRIAFGADFHKSGLWNRPLLDQIRKRENAALLLLGDSAVDDRDANVGLHRSDYQLRDLSPGWQELAASVPIYAAWDDHDYFNNDKSGVPSDFTASDRTAVRAVWSESWNNPTYGDGTEGIYFRTRIGQCDVIMLDTRFFRTAPKQPNAFLGEKQWKWLVEQLSSCKGPFVILTSGTMWSDYVSGGKDSWGKWDPAARERIFSLIEEKKIGGVLLLSGDRHGARVIQIPRPSGFVFHEYEMGSLGAHPGPPAMGKIPSSSLQPFGLSKTSAFGEFTFDTTIDDPSVTMRAVGENGEILYEETLTRSQLTPGIK